MLEEIAPDESRKHSCDRLAPKLSVKAVTFYNWVKQSAPGRPCLGAAAHIARIPPSGGSVTATARVRNRQASHRNPKKPSRNSKYTAPSGSNNDRSSCDKVP